MPKIVSAPAAPVSLRLPPAQLERVRIHAKNSGLSPSTYMARAIVDYLDRDVDHAMEKPIPVQPEGLSLKAGVDIHRGEYVQHWNALGYTVHITSNGTPTLRDSVGDGCFGDEFDALFQQFKWRCGSSGPLKDPDFLPTHRHPQDEAWLDWWEYDFTEKNMPEMVERVQAIRAHIATLPDPATSAVTDPQPTH